MRVRLLNYEGHAVGTFEIPPFNEPPKVVGWGDRVFDRRPLPEIDDAGAHTYVYTECFAYAIVSEPLPAAPTPTLDKAPS